MSLIGKLAQLLFYTFFIALFAWVSARLFFEDYTRGLESEMMTFIFPKEEVVIERIDDFKIIYPVVIDSLEPTIIQPAVRERLVNIYEPLVEPDRDLNIKNSLALSWGLLDDNLTWEFHLRPNVSFHDGTPFGAGDVIASINRARNYEGSEIVDLLDTIDEIEIIDELTLRIKTFDPDPLLLQKISTVLIIPEEHEDDELAEPIGTGSYKFEVWDEELRLNRFDDYWGDAAEFNTIKIFSVEDKFERVNKLLKNEADFLAFVPSDAASFVDEGDFEVDEIPSLEVQFLLFNFDSKIFKTKDARRAISLALNQNELVTLLGGFARPVSQFVSNGVFGFNPDIADHAYSLDAAKDFAETAGLNGKTVFLHLPIGLEVLGDYVREQLSEIGVLVVVSYLDLPDLQKSIEQGDADLYFLAFKSDIGDASGFLDTVLHSDGYFNIGRYKNDLVDALIDESFQELDVKLRLEQLQEVMKIAVEDDIVGVPLFEYETIFAYDERLNLQPRIDGLIYFDEITQD